MRTYMGEVYNWPVTTYTRPNSNTLPDYNNLYQTIGQALTVQRFCPHSIEQSSELMTEVKHSNHPPDEEQLLRVSDTRGECLRENEEDNKYGGHFSDI